MKYCQGPLCHTYKTKDRIRGPKGDKHYETRKRSSFYYLDGNCCSMQCMYDWFNKFGKMALDHFGRVTEPKRVGCDGAWYKDILGAAMVITITTYTMIYLVDAYQLLESSTLTVTITTLKI